MNIGNAIPERNFDPDKRQQRNRALGAGRSIKRCSFVMVDRGAAWIRPPHMTAI
jgi:hypothetical protein